MLGYEDASKKFRTEPSEDCISRQAVDDAIYDYSRSCDVNYEQIMEFIDKLPSVTPQTVTEFADKCKECGKIQNEFFNFDAPMVKKSDAVSREAVNVLVDELARAISDERIGISRGRSTATIMRDILHLSSVTPERPKGKWIEIKIDVGEFVYKCTKCGMRVIVPYKYCPICGSYNGGGEDEAND